MGEVLPLVFSCGALLTGIAAVITVFLNRSTSKETVSVNHSAVVFEGFSDLNEALQTQITSLTNKYDVLSATVERQDGQITQLRIELRDRDDQIRMLTLDRDDLVALVVDPNRPNLRTI